MTVMLHYKISTHTDSAQPRILTLYVPDPLAEPTVLAYCHFISPQDDTDPALIVQYSDDATIHTLLGVGGSQLQPGETTISLATYAH